MLENDTPGVTVSKTTLTVHEEDTAGGDYTVVLDSEPGADVTVTVAGQAGTDARLDGASLTFTPMTWDTPQTVTVTAVDDADSDNDEVALTHAAASADADYQGIAIAGVAVTVDDNDDPSTQVTFAVAPEGVAEDAAATAVTVTGMLDGAPRADETVVYVTVSAGTAGAGEFTPVTAFALSIAAGLRTGTAQFEFAPVDDKVDEGTETVVVDGFTLAPGLAVVPVNLSILDDDTRGLVFSTPAVTVTEGGTTVDEDPVTGGAAAYTVVLASQPTGPVTVHADAPAGTIVRVASSGAPALTASLHFTTANWQTAQTVTVTAVHDEDGMDIELSAGLAIAHRVTGADYQGLAVDDTVAVKVIDDDKPRIVVETLSMEFTEGEELKDAYTVKLRTQPTGDVTVTLGVPAELTAELAMGSLPLTFTPDDWETAQTVQVSAKDDDDALPPGTGTVDYTITHSGHRRRLRRGAGRHVHREGGRRRGRGVHRLAGDAGDRRGDGGRRFGEAREPARGHGQGHDPQERNGRPGRDVDPGDAHLHDDRLGRRRRLSG